MLRIALHLALLAHLLVVILTIIDLVVQVLLVCLAVIMLTILASKPLIIIEVIQDLVMASIQRLAAQIKPGHMVLQLWIQLVLQFISINNQLVAVNHIVSPISTIIAGLLAMALCILLLIIRLVLITILIPLRMLGRGITHYEINSQTYSLLLPFLHLGCNHLSYRLNYVINPALYHSHSPLLAWSSLRRHAKMLR